MDVEKGKHIEDNAGRNSNDNSCYLHFLYETLADRSIEANALLTAINKHLLINTY